MLQVIARIENDYTTKFGVPRQSGLVTGLTGRIIFEPEYRSPDAVKELDRFDYIWLLWGFSQAERKRPDGTRTVKDSPQRFKSNKGKISEGFAQGDDEIKTEEEIKENKEKTVWTPMVRPPRLGGNRRVGVFASRSPFRPNPIGISSVKLIRIEPDTPRGPIIYVDGIDMTDGTPIYDIKPYLPDSDSHPDASSGFTEEYRQYRLSVECPDELLEIFPEEKREPLIKTLSQDPRPGYHKDPDREYIMSFAGFNVRFKVRDDILYVLDIY